MGYKQIPRQTAGLMIAGVPGGSRTDKKLIRTEARSMAQELIHDFDSYADLIAYPDPRCS